MGFGSVDVDGLGQSVDARNATSKCATGTRQSHELPCFADFWPVFLRSASIDASDVMGRRLKKEVGDLTVYDAALAGGSKCAIDHANFAVV
jgi:hypothetical protein